MNRWGGIDGVPMEFVGFENFRYLLFEDLWFWKTIWVTAWLLVFGSFTQHLIAIPLAIVLNNKFIRGRDLFKTVFFMPYITNAVSITLIFGYLFSTEYGLFNYLFSFIGIEKIRWLQDENTIPVAIAILVNWRYIGWNTVIYLAGLQAIPAELYESAEIDGAKTFAKHWRITIPLILPIIFFAVTLSIIGGMQLFDEPFLLTGGMGGGTGGTNRAGFTAAFYVIWLLRRANRYGKGSAVSWLVFIMILTMTFINRFVTTRLEGTNQKTHRKKKQIEPA
ncbi:MAG: sugar ABC transporter permease [Spirochaetales bacterium]|nr:sugar ABC transporter permease [Spirochaetales bacterium]